MTIGQRLRAARKMAGFQTIKDMPISKMEQAYLSGVEADEWPLEDKDFSTLADLYSTHVEWLQTGEEPM